MEPPPSEPTGAQQSPGGSKRVRRKAAGGAPPKQRSTKRIAVIAGTAALTTAVSGIVGGVVSPDRVQSVLGLSAEPTGSPGDSQSPSDSESASDSDSPSAGTSPSAPNDGPALEFRRVTDGTRAIAVDVPASWGLRDDGFTGIEAITSPGVALRAGPDPNAFRIQSEETVYVGASRRALDDLGLRRLDDAQIVRRLERRRTNVPYLPDAGCTPTNEHTPALGDDWVGAAQAWVGCFSVDGWRAIEVEMVSVTRDAYVFIQIGLPASTPDEVSQRILDSLTVLPRALPKG